MRQPTDAALRNARAEFRDLLEKPTAEATWQSFCSTNPFVLSRALPLRLEPCDILPLGRPGFSEPDFLIHPGSDTSARVHGLIELKTQSARVMTATRRNVLCLTRSADTAVRQLQIYDRYYDLFSPSRRGVSLSSASHLFVIMGMRQEIVNLSARLDIILQIEDLLPPNVRILAFDELLQRYEAGVPLRSFVLVPDAALLNTSVPADLDQLVAGAVLKRREILERFGGSLQRGISSSVRSPDVFLFCSPEPDVGKEHGYLQDWKEDGCFHYIGEGLYGDQCMTRGNRVILDAAEERRAIRLFSGYSGSVKYQGRFQLDSAQPFYLQETIDRGGSLRKVIVFRLRPGSRVHGVGGCAS